MSIITAFAYMLIGAVLMWLGAFMLITAMVPREVGVAFAEKHGAWVREHVLRLSPNDGKAEP